MSLPQPRSTAPAEPHIAGDNVYAAAVLAQAPRLLSLADREPRSPHYGSFDREHWSWKFRDFPLGMLQVAAYPLALLWQLPISGSPYYRNPRLLEAILGAIQAALLRQHRDGSLDGFAPNERSPAIAVGVMHGLGEAFLLVRQEVPSHLETSFLAALRRAFDCALRHEEMETHAFVSNHWAQAASGFLVAHELLADAKYRQRAERLLERVLREQSADGWYAEYGGPDPGYESLGIHHLATYWKRTGDGRVLDSLRRAVEFYSHCVHPDGSVGGTYGSRQTALYFPAGFEILSSQLPAAAAIAGFLRPRLCRGGVVTPAVADPENLIPLCYSYLEAARQAETPATVPMPCVSLEGHREFAASGVCVNGTRRYYAVLNSSKGGVCRVFDKGSARMVYEDSGYLVRSQDRLWVSQRLGMGKSLPQRGPGEVVSATQFTGWQPMSLTPGKFLFLRLLNLTVFRSPALGNWVRDRIISRLLISVAPAPMRLQRTVRFEPDRILFQDRLELLGHEQVQDIHLPRSLTAFHMGSTKYFHPGELEPRLEPPVAQMAGMLNRQRFAELAFAIVWEDQGPPRLELNRGDGYAEPAAEVISKP